MHEDVEGFGDAWGWHHVAFHNRLVGTRTTSNVVRLDRQNFLEDVGGTESFECPHLHLTKALTTKLGFTTQWLLRDERVWTDATCVHLVVYHVA